MARGTRVRVSEGIYRDAYGYAAVAAGREKRYPPDTPIAVMQRWRHERSYRRRAAGPRRVRGTLTADVARYIDQIGHLASWRERRAELRAWTALYGPMQRYRLQRKHVLAARQAWLEAGKSPKTINHRVDALRALWHALDPHDETPCDDVDPLTVPKRPVQTVSVDTIRAVYAGLLAGEQRGTLRTAKTRARFMVLAASGVRPSELMRTLPGDVDLDRRIWRTRDGKGGVRPGGLYLYDDLLEAWKVFVAADAWGPYETSAFARTLREAGWPAGVRPYTLRHATGMALSEAGTDLADVSGWLGHARPETTRGVYVPILGSRMQQAGERLAGRIAWHKILEAGETRQNDWQI